MPLEGDLFDDRGALAFDPGATLLGGFALHRTEALLAEVAAVAAVAPFRHLETPGGRRMLVAMTNTGAIGWISDRYGYRYIQKIRYLAGRAENGLLLHRHTGLESDRR